MTEIFLQKFLNQFFNVTNTNVMFIVALLSLVASANAHTAAFAPGMYCLGGTDPSQDNPHTNDAVVPLYNLPRSQWWFQADRGCDRAPPAPGVFLELPAGGSFTVELAHNRAQTTLSFNGEFTSDWPDGQQHPEDWKGPGNPPDCIQEDGALHTNNQSMAAGTAFAISYVSDISAVTMENLAVSSTPWKRIATYQVPRDLLACPADGCTCAWLWVPKGCGEPNMYMQGFKCKVTGSTSTRRLAPAQPPRYCPNFNECTRGAKQMIATRQAEGNNIELPPNNDFVSYSPDWGFSPGAQNDIFL
ncbi:uncharacterized protein LOC118433424 isoform X2 [Folsomia candida]|uniref:Uncharacterized protein n=1 Tax=Folsomia candida TaxID=158441 RepID=A0A226CX31_FOLCA|nr:uncharacterized protein LOC118433424 isoform X2 [Folsomia candida]OXA37882.1 hypothetical protein Fcan01_27321 [Folsomia candida]